MTDFEEVLVTGAQVEAKVGQLWAVSGLYRRSHTWPSLWESVTWRRSSYINVLKFLYAILRRHSV